MRWIIKAAGFKALSLPGGASIYGRLGASLRPGRKVASARAPIDLGSIYLQESSRYLGEGGRPDRLMHIDIGAGWAPYIPLLLYCAGVERQLLCDIRPLMTMESVMRAVHVFNDAVYERKDLIEGLQRIAPYPGRDESLKGYLQRLGMRYKAPYSLGDLSHAGGPKLITCTGVLMYLREEHLRVLFSEVARALAASNGAFCASVNLTDVAYAPFDRSLSPYHKWRHSASTWNLVLNSRLMHQNRLVPSDYRKLLREAGFEVPGWRLERPTDAGLRDFRSKRPHPDFRSVPEDELAARKLIFTAVLPPDSLPKRAT
jgi:hypothetical protein